MELELNIKDLDLLYSDALKLKEDILTSKIDNNILNRLNLCINNIIDNWQSQDANIQINKIISLYNDIIGIRSYIGNLAVFLYSLAQTYRDAQITNGAKLNVFNEIRYNSINEKEAYVNDSPTLYVGNNIQNVFTILDDTIEDISQLSSSIIVIRESIFSNWVVSDENRSYAVNMFDDILNKLSTYKQSINDVINNIRTALSNYSNVTAKKVEIPSLIEMNRISDSKRNVIKEEAVLEHIQKNLNDNKEMSQNFNDALRNQVIKDLQEEGYYE